jgi:hypothetical protein
MLKHIKQYAMAVNYAVPPPKEPTIVVNLLRVSFIHESVDYTPTGGYKYGETCWLYIDGRKEHIRAPFIDVRDDWLAAHGEEV